MLHCREYSARCTEKPCCNARHLPVEVPPVDNYGKGIYLGVLTGIEYDMNFFLEKIELDTVELEEVL